jgi:pilus assembly protein CpaC
VRPAAPGDVMRTPADDTLPPNDPDFFLLGKTEMTREEAAKLTPAEAQVVAASSQPFTGHMLDMPRGISNAAIQ